MCRALSPSWPVVAFLALLVAAFAWSTAARAQVSVAQGMTIYTTAFPGTNLPANGCTNAACHGAGAPAVASVGHQLASNNPTRISNAIAANTGGMGGLTLNAAQLRSLALYIGQIKAPLPANAALPVTVNTPATIDVYPLLPGDGTSGAAQDAAGVTATNGTNGTTSVSIATNVGAGTIAYNITYTPNLNFVGADSFTYTITNSTGNATRTITVTVSPAGPPVISSPAAAGGTVGQVFTVTPIVASNFPTAFSGTGLPPGLSVDPVTGNISGTPQQAGTFNATLTASNGINPPGTRIVPFTIAAAPTAPGAGAVTMTVPFNTPTTLDLAPFITMNTATGIVIVTSPAHGAATVSGTRVTFTPVTNYFGPDAFTYAAINAIGTSSPGTVTVNVVGRPDPTRDAAVTGLVAAQVDAALRFSRAQISNFQRRMESLHRRNDGESGGARALSPGTDRAATTGPAAATAATAAAMRQMGAEPPALPGQDPVRVASASASPQRDAQGGGSAFSRLFPLVTDAASILTSRSVNLGNLAAHATGTDGSARNPGAVNFWVEGNASFGTRDPTAGRSGLDFSTSGISFGADRQFGDQWALGIGAGFARDRTDIGTDGTQSRAHGLSAALYGSFQPGRNLFVDGLIGVGKLDFEMQRFVAPVTDFARSDRDGYQVFGSLAAGYEHRANGVLVSPYARVDYSADRLDQATETGAGAFALTYFKQNTSSVQGALGLRAESVHATHFGWAAPRIRVEYRHEFQDERLMQLAYADLIGGPRFAVSTGPISRDALAVGIGSDFVWRDGLTIGIDYQLLRSSENASHAFRLRISKELDGPGPGSALHGAAAPSGPPLDIRVDAGWLYDDNVTRSRERSEMLGDQSYSLNVGKVITIPLTSHVRALVGGSIGAEKFRNYDGLSKVTAGFSGDLQYRPSAEFGAPTFALFGRATAEQYESERRDGYRNSIGLSMRQSLTDRIDVFGALAHNERYADSAVFTTRDNSARLNLDWGVGPRSTLYMGAEYRRGDIVSSGRPSLENIDIAEVLVADDAYPGKGFFAYRFEGRTVITTLGYNLGLGPRDSLDFSWRRGEATPSLRPSFATSSSSYIANQFSIVYLTRF